MEIDYEEKYNEALERAKRLRDSKYQTMNAKRVVEEIFPVLAESEDEQIRKELIAILKKSYNSGITLNNKKDLDRYLAYLEKQKESLHIQETCKENADSFTGGIIEVRSFQRGIEEGRRREKQKEQTSSIIIKAFENSKTDYSLEEREEASDYSEKVLPTSITYGENEDEYRLHKIIEAAYIAGQKEQKLPITGNDFGWIDELKHDLEHPEELDQKVQEVLKKRQKPVEWSEEDEKTLDCIINVLDRLGFEEYCKSSRDQDVEEERFYYKEIQCLKKLKSLRPPQYCKNCRLKKSVQGWKPSEEQMNGLAHAINLDVYDAKRYGLDSLYNDLKKLM